MNFPYGQTAKRPTWNQLPSAAKKLVEEAAGSPVVSAINQGGGFTNGFASILEFEDGSELFVKVGHKTDGPHIFNAYTQEASVASKLPPQAKSPKLHWDVQTDGWVILAFEVIKGEMPTRPWSMLELNLVLDALKESSEALTPRPAAFKDLLPISSLDSSFTFWRDAANGEEAAKLVPEGWENKVEELAEMEGRWSLGASGETAVHFDVRDDNLIISNGEVYICDWNWLTLGAPWLDAIGVLVSAQTDGISAQKILQSRAELKEVNPDFITSFLVALSGYCIKASAGAEVETSPWLRTHQKIWRDGTLSWLGERLK